MQNFGSIFDTVTFDEDEGDDTDVAFWWDWRVRSFWVHLHSFVINSCGNTGPLLSPCVKWCKMILDDVWCVNVITVDRGTAASNRVGDNSSRRDACVQHVPTPAAEPPACLRHPRGCSWDDLYGPLFPGHIPQDPRTVTTRPPWQNCHHTRIKSCEKTIVAV